MKTINTRIKRAILIIIPNPINLLPNNKFYHIVILYLIKYETNKMLSNNDKFDSFKNYYIQNGVAVLRNIIDEEWLTPMKTAIDNVLKNPGPASIEYTPQNEKGRYYGDFFIWRNNETFKNFAFNSILPEIAAKILESKKINFFYDQLLVKEPNTKEPTPWHHDLPYWPIKGKQIISIWIPFDEVSKETGAVEYIQGSHKWGKMFAPTSFGKKTKFSDLYEKMGLEKLPDIESNKEKYDIISWNVKPGDIVVHHPLVVHSSSGNFSSKYRRRGLALRYIGEDVTCDDREGTFMENNKIKKMLPTIILKDGEELTSELFPIIWQD